ncbi:MAG TPA: cyclase family protein [Thermotogota bacterium]|nr:cyclase family protein [Thermotogota bacterium]HRW92317.1 cyclase family protein [Thermotogota bacterium]
MKIIDLSYRLQNGMPFYPGTEAPQFSRPFSLEKHGFAETRLTLLTHVGTHLDCPAHMIPSGATTDTTPLERFFGEGLLLDCQGHVRDGFILESVLSPQMHALLASRFVLFRTGWESFWGKEEYFHGFPVFSPGLAELLVARGVKGVGVDTISIDGDASEGFANHHLLLGAGITVVENLCCLPELQRELSQKDAPLFSFGAFPLKISGGDGSPVRAFALVHE